MSTRWVTKRSGAPEGHKLLIQDIPLDVLIEIFLFLDPLDLLYLARTSKALRRFLLNRCEASTLWGTVIRNVRGFPPCPDHMSAPAYTHLAFVPVCHGCFCPCVTIEWDLRMRCCPDCLPKMTMSPDSLRDADLRSLQLPMAYKHYKLFDSGWDVTVHHETIRSDYSYSRVDWEVAQTHERSRDVPVDEFVAQQNEYWASIRWHARLCQDWEHRRLVEEATELSLVRKQRIEDIKHKFNILDLGWIDDVWLQPGVEDFLQLPEVRKLEPLMPSEWPEILPGLINWTRRTKKETSNYLCLSTFTSISLLIRQQLRSDTSLKVQPREIDIAMLPAVRSIFESVKLESESDLDAFGDSLRKVLPLAIRRWNSNVVDELEVFACGQLGLSPQTLPSVIFWCKSCPRGTKRHSRLTFDEALSHDHLYKGRQRGDTGKADEITAYDKILMNCDTDPRDIQVLEVDITVSRRVENLIKRMGQNPRRVTLDELRRSTVKVVCGLCGPEIVADMNFEHAFKHCFDAHIQDKETEVWTCPSAEE